MGREFYVYKYENNRGEVVYIGKTNASLAARINAHKTEPAFKGEDYVISFAELSNSVETDAVEKLLINYYKPQINIKDKVPFLSANAQIPNIEWKPISEYYALHKHGSDKDALLLKEVTKKCEIIDAVIESDKEEVSLPFEDNSLWMDGELRCPFEKGTVYKDGLYISKIKKGGKQFVLNNCMKLYYEAWLPYLQNGLSKMGEKTVRMADFLGEFEKKVSDFESNGFYSEELPFDEVIKVPTEYEALFGLIGNYFKGKPKPIPSGYLLIWDRFCAKRFKENVDDLYGNIVMKLKESGDICEKELEKYGRT